MRADLYVALLRGTPLPEAVRHLCHHDLPDHCERHSDKPAGRLTEQPTGPVSGRTEGRHTTADGETAAAQTRAMAAATAHELRGELTRLIADARRVGKAGPDAPIVVQAVHEITEALAGLRLRWCLERLPSPLSSQGDEAATSGEPSHGVDGYRPSAWMRRHVRERDGSCRFPTCHRPAVACDLDHTRAHQRGGPTCPCNLAELCRRHHTLKQTPGWALFQPWPGVLLWTTPSGQWYIVGPDP